MVDLDNMKLRSPARSRTGLISDVTTEKFNHPKLMRESTEIQLILIVTIDTVFIAKKNVFLPRIGTDANKLKVS